MSLNFPDLFDPTVQAILGTIPPPASSSALIEVIDSSNPRFERVYFALTSPTNLPQPHRSFISIDATTVIVFTYDRTTLAQASSHILKFNGVSLFSAVCLYYSGGNDSDIITTGHQSPGFTDIARHLRFLSAPYFRSRLN